jgi:hypothetical protein
MHATSSNQKTSVFCKEYLDVGCTMKNEKCHLVFCLLYPNLKLAIGCNIFLKLQLGRKGGAIIVDMSATIEVGYVTFDVGLALTCQTTLFCWVIGIFFLF